MTVNYGSYCSAKIKNLQSAKGASKGEDSTIDRGRGNHP
jgi:hypothetical protein